MKKRPRPAYDRTIQFKIMLSVSERAILDRVAKLHGLTATDVIRQYIRSMAGNT